MFGLQLKNARLLKAAEQGETETVLALLEADASRKWAVDRARHAALDVAALNGRTQTVLALIQAGANIESGTEGETALHLAAKCGHTQTALALIQAGANIEAMDQYGCTALHSAALEGHIETTLVLLAAGANKEAVNHNGHTALHFAQLAKQCLGEMMTKHTEIIQLLTLPTIEKQKLYHEFITAHWDICDSPIVQKLKKNLEQEATGKVFPSLKWLAAKSAASKYRPEEGRVKDMLPDDVFLVLQAAQSFCKAVQPNLPQKQRATQCILNALQKVKTQAGKKRPFEEIKGEESQSPERKIRSVID